MQTRTIDIGTRVIIQKQKRMAKILKTLVYNQKENIFIELENISFRTLI